MCQGDSVSGTREVKLLFSIFCSTSTFIWNYLLSLLSAAATGSNVQWNNKQLSFRKYVLLTLTGAVSLPIGRLETRKTCPYFSIFKLLPLFLYFFKIYFGTSLYISVDSRSPVFCATATHFIYICGGKDSAALHLCPRERWGKLMRLGKYLWWNNCGWWWMSRDRTDNDVNEISQCTEKDLVESA